MRSDAVIIDPLRPRESRVLLRRPRDNDDSIVAGIYQRVMCNRLRETFGKVF